MFDSGGSCIKIEKASVNDIDAIADLYDKIHTEEEEGRAVIGWARGVYPAYETAEESVKRGDMFVLKDGNDLIAAGIINKCQLDAYSSCIWTIDAKDDEIMVLHTLVVNPLYKGKGAGKTFVKFYEEYAHEQGCSVLRIDTQAKNKRARAFYKKLGFSEAGTVLCDFNGISDIELICLEKGISK